MHLIERRAVRFATVVLAALTLVFAAGVRHHRRLRRPAGRPAGRRVQRRQRQRRQQQRRRRAAHRGDRPPGDTPEEAQRKAAEIAWTTFPRRFELLRLDIGGRPSSRTARSSSRSSGHATRGLDDKALEDDIRNLGIGVLIALAVGFVLCVGLIILIIVLVRRSGKKKRAQQQQQWGGRRAGLRPAAVPGQPSTASRSSTASPSSPQPQPPAATAATGVEAPPRRVSNRRRGCRASRPAQANSDALRARAASGGTKRSHAAPGQVVHEHPAAAVDRARAHAPQRHLVPRARVALVRVEVVARVVVGLGPHDPVAG